MSLWSRFLGWVSKQDPPEEPPFVKRTKILASYLIPNTACNDWSLEFPSNYVFLVHAGQRDMFTYRFLIEASQDIQFNVGSIVFLTNSSEGVSLTYKFTRDVTLIHGDTLELWMEIKR